ncbi:hypothetical protein SEVIR_3G028601v4 [Setaria viridis]
MPINGLVASLRELGEAMEDNHVVKKILRVVPKKMKQIAVAIDFNTTSVEEVVGRLRVEEDADVKEAANDIRRLLLTEEQWEARRHQRSGKKRACDSDPRHGSGKKGAGRSGGLDQEDDDDDGGATSVRAQAGANAALARASASIVVSAATSRGSTPSQGRRKHCLPTPMMSRRSCRARRAAVSWFRSLLE